MGKLTKAVSKVSSLHKKSTNSIQSLKNVGEQQREHIHNNSEALMITIDISGSMRSFIDADMIEYPSVHTCLDAAKTATLKLMEKSDAMISRIGITTFNHDGRVVCNVGTSIFNAKHNLEKVKAFERTIMHRGMLVSRHILEDTLAKVKRIVLMTDGCTERPEECIEEAHSCKERDIIVDTVSFGPNCNTKLLKEIAQTTGGVYKEANHAHELITQFKQLEVRTRGLLTSGE